MTTYKDLFGDEICKCGKPGEYIISRSNKIQGFECKACKTEREQKQPNKAIINASETII